MTTAKTFGQFDIKVKASRIKRAAEKASDITVYKPNEKGELVPVQVIARDGLGRARGETGYEAEVTVRKAA